MDLLLVKLVFTLRMAADGFEPQRLFQLKKPFEESFRNTVCRGRGDCETCTIRDGCPCQAVFGQELARDPEVVKRHQKPPLPFAFQFDTLPARLGRGEEFELGLVLVGRAAGFVKEFCTATEQLFGTGGRGVFPAAAVVGIESAGCTGFRSPIRTEKALHDPAGLCTISLDDLLSLNTLASDRISLRLLTPLRNLSDGRAVTLFSFSSFIRPLLRRISSLSRYYYGDSLPLDYKRLAVLSESVEIGAGDFRWQERSKGQPEGIVGQGGLNGQLADFHPALLLGEYLNCGKGAAYGFGRYQIIR